MSIGDKKGRGMRTGDVLIVDDDAVTLQLIAATLEDARLPFQVAVNSDEACAILKQNSAVSLVLLRGYSEQISGLELCRRIRSEQPDRRMSVLILLRDAEIASGVEFLMAGADDLLIGAFEPRELRMRAGMIVPDQRQRVHSKHVGASPSEQAADSFRLVVPEFDPRHLRFTFGVNESQRKIWQNDPDTRSIALDRILVCPCCEAVPTFRPGCGVCGSAWIDPQVLIHHYACAHVGPEQEFQTDSGLTCPKCRLQGLVSGADFECASGAFKCRDCLTVTTELTMVGHCLACEHRFVAEEGLLQPIYGYQVRRPASTASAADRRGPVMRADRNGSLPGVRQTHRYRNQQSELTGDLAAAAAELPGDCATFQG